MRRRARREREPQRRRIGRMVTPLGRGQPRWSASRRSTLATIEAWRSSSCSRRCCGSPRSSARCCGCATGRSGRAAAGMRRSDTQNSLPSGSAIATRRPRPGRRRGASPRGRRDGRPPPAGHRRQVERGRSASGSSRSSAAPADRPRRSSCRRPATGSRSPGPGPRPAASPAPAPEVPDLLRPVAGQLAEEATAGEEAVARLDDAELVALGVGEHHVALLRELSDVEVPGAEAERPSHGRLLVGEGGARQVEVDLVRAGLRLVGRQRTGSGSRWRRSAGARAVAVVDQLPAQQAGPEAREARAGRSHRCRARGGEQSSRSTLGRTQDSRATRLRARRADVSEPARVPRPSDEVAVGVG